MSVWKAAGDRLALMFEGRVEQEGILRPHIPNPDTQVIRCACERRYADCSDKPRDRSIAQYEIDSVNFDDSSKKT